MAEVGSQIHGHLADWLLTREQFEPIPGAAGQYRLTTPERDGQRRAHQAVHDLRRLAYRVHADAALDPPAPPHPVQDRGCTNGAAVSPRQPPARPSDRPGSHRLRAVRSASPGRAPAQEPRQKSLEPLPHPLRVTGRPGPTRSPHRKHA
ncbi:hypothetical protein O1M63_04500 [Streptomyces mirabilis]|nr:hypothetical protein [Streptomyces mirabilis]